MNNDNRSDIETRKRLDEIHELVSFSLLRTYKILRVICAVVIFMAIAGGWLIYQNHLRTQEIQNQRIEAMLINCQDQNYRNISTKAILDEQFKKITKNFTPAQKLATNRSKAFTILLIDALAPFRDCKKAINRANKGDVL
jgi:hypothetical protein